MSARLPMGIVLLRNVGIKVTLDDGEYRVAYLDEQDPEASAYYTTDAQDALDTGRAMARHKGLELASDGSARRIK